MYLVWMAPGTTPEQVRTTMLDTVAPALLELGVHGLTMDLDDEFAQIPPLMPPPEGEDQVRAIVSVWVDAYDYCAPVEAVLAAHAVRIAGYQAVESLYRDYGGNEWSAPRDWPERGSAGSSATASSAAGSRRAATRTGRPAPPREHVAAAPPHTPPAASPSSS